MCPSRRPWWGGPVEIPEDEPRSPGTETEVQSGRVHDHPVAGADAAEHERVTDRRDLGAVDGHSDPHDVVRLFDDPDDLAFLESGH